VQQNAAEVWGVPDILIPPAVPLEETISQPCPSRV
jgi:hypothetical protein